MQRWGGVDSAFKSHKAALMQLNGCFLSYRTVRLGMHSLHTHRDKHTYTLTQTHKHIQVFSLSFFLSFDFVNKAWSTLRFFLHPNLNLLSHNYQGASICPAPPGGTPTLMAGYSEHPSCHQHTTANHRTRVQRQN